MELEKYAKNHWKYELFSCEDLWYSKFDSWTTEVRNVNSRGLQNLQDCQENLSRLVIEPHNYISSCLYTPWRIPFKQQPLPKFWFSIALKYPL